MKFGKDVAVSVLLATAPVTGSSFSNFFDSFSVSLIILHSLPTQQQPLICLLGRDRKEREGNPCAPHLPPCPLHAPLTCAYTPAHFSQPMSTCYETPCTLTPCTFDPQGPSCMPQCTFPDMHCSPCVILDPHGTSCALSFPLSNPCPSDTPS